MTNSFSLKAQYFGVFHNYIGCFESNQLKTPMGFYHRCDIWSPKSTGTSQRTHHEDVDSRCKILALHGGSNDSREVWNSMVNNKSQVEGFGGMDKGPIFVRQKGISIYRHSETWNFQVLVRKVIVRKGQTWYPNPNCTSWHFGSLLLLLLLEGGTSRSLFVNGKSESISPPM